MTDYQDIFDSALAGKPVTKQSTDYAELFDNVLKAYTNPVGAAGELSWHQIKDAFTPDTRVEGLQAQDTERSPNYPVASATDVSVPDTMNAAAGLSMVGGALGMLPKVEIDLRSKPPVEPIGLPDPIKSNAIDTELANTFEEALKPQAKAPTTDYKATFEEALKPESTPEIVTESQGKSLEAQRLREMWAETAKEQSGTSPLDVAPYVRPDLFEANTPTAPEPAMARSESGQVSIPSKEDVKGALQNYASKFDISGQYDEVQGMKAEHFGNLEENLFKDQVVKRDIFKGLTPAEDRAVGYLAENSPIPEPYLKDPKKADVVQAIQNPSDKLKEAVGKYKSYMADRAKDLQLHQPEFDPRTDYSPLVVNAPREVLSDKAPKMTGKSRFLQQRNFKNKAEALNAGFTEKYPTTSQEMDLYSRSVRTAIAQKQFANTITKTTGLDGEPLAYPKKVMGPNGTPVLNERLPEVVKNGAELSPLLADHYFTPKVYDQLKFMKGLDKPENPMKAYDQASAVMKKAELSLSFFHHLTLTESSIAMGVNPVKLYNTIKDATKLGGAAFVKPELTADFLKHNGKLSYTADEQKGVIQKVAEGVDKLLQAGDLTRLGLPADQAIAAKALKPLVKVEDVWDSALWENIQPAMKLNAYEQNLAAVLGSKKFQNIPTATIKRQIADMVNSYFGGQEANLIFDNPKMAQAIQRSLLAMDWTVSNIRIPLSLPNPDVKGFVARRAYFRMALLFLGVTEAGNMINKKIQGQEGWEKGTLSNDPGHKFDMWMYKDNNGMNHYVTVNKGFVEIFRWLTDPVNEASHKANPLFSTIANQLWPSKWNDFNRPYGRIKDVAGKFIPFATSSNSFGGMLSMSQGISITKMKDQMEYALYKNDWDSIQKLKETAANNGIGVFKFNQILKTVQSEIKGKAKYEAKRDSAPGPMSSYVEHMTGFKVGNISDVAGRELQSLRDRLNAKQTREQHNG